MMDAMDKELVREAIAHLRAGRKTDALTTLERAVDPKWGSQGICRDQYTLSMERKR